MLFAMGAGGRLIGVSSYDAYPPEVTRLPKLGGLLDPDVERLLALRPDLVIVYATQADLRRQLERAVIPTFVYKHRALSDITETIRALGDRISATRPAEALAGGIEAQFAAVRTRVAGQPRPKTLLVIGRENGTLRGILASGGVGFLHDLLEIAGAADALGDIKRESVTLSTEMILARAPDIVIELHYGADLRLDRIGPERRVWNTLASVPAVKTGRVVLIAGDEFVVPGPRVGAVAERFAKVLHPELFR
jgi:iron complex transport system substrate-binding protein